MDTLIVKHFPSTLNNEDKKDLLCHFGAASVRCMDSQGRLRNTAFATFPDKESAAKALKQLHQLDVLGSSLVVEFSKSENSEHHPGFDDRPKKVEDVEEKSEQDVKKAADFNVPVQNKVAEELNSISSKWGLQYPINPKLRYLYPPPSVNILANVANAMASKPKFYVQVLHLMNKMNLPAPFGPLTPTPPIPEDFPPPPPQQPPLPPEPSSSEEESEIESDVEGDVQNEPLPQPVKRPAKIRRAPKKRQKIQHVLQPATAKSSIPLAKREEVFEQPLPTIVKKIELKLPADLVASGSLDVAPVDMSHAPSIPPAVEEMPLSEEAGGFGKIDPVTKPDTSSSDEDEEDSWGEGKFISSRRLRRGRISRSEMRDFPAFRSYQEGEPTSRLYIKNLAKQVTEKDLHYIFGLYVNWDIENEKNMFDIRLMKEGRMKGQAFITLPSESKAKDALADTHGFILHGKPMAVQFARSAKPKPK